MSARLIKHCELCGGELDPVLSLGSSPPTCHMVPVNAPVPAESHYPLEVLYCEHCTHAQLSVVVDPEEVFPEDYPYSSGNSGALHDNFAELAEQTMSRVGPNADDLVVDIGANDGTLLSKFWGRKVGVEPTAQGERIDGEHVHGFFGLEVAKQIRDKYGPAKVITACNVLAHVDDVHDVLFGITHLLADDGVFVAENHDLASVVGGQWDTVYHEHLRFFSPHSFNRLLKRHGLGALDVREIDTHGGSFRTTAHRGKHVAWQPRLQYDWGKAALGASSARLLLRKHGPFWGIGATARATTIINYCGLDVEDVPAVCEVAGSDKIGRYIPGTRIPVVDERELMADQPKNALIFSWHMADRIAPKLREAGYEGNILAPLPTLRYV